jgi:hypothetical protein
MIEVLVSCNDRHRYPAWIDPDDQRDGYVKPWFDLETVRRIADDTQAEAARFGHGSVDTIHVIAGQVSGTERVVVLNVCWMYLALNGDRCQQAAEIVQPNADGRYAIGGFEWCWYALSDDLMPLIPYPAEQTTARPHPEL